MPSTPVSMASTEIYSLRDSAIVAIIDAFGLSYFSIFALHCLVFSFPSSTGEILHLVATLLFAAGVIAWSFLSLFYRTMVAFKDDSILSWQKLEFGGILFLIFTTSASYVILQFPARSTVQLGYLCTLSVAFVAHLVDLLVANSGVAATRRRFPYHCVSLTLFGMIPVVQAFTDPLQNGSPLLSEITRFVAYNVVGVAQYFARPLEWMNLLVGWQPSLYVMHVVLMFSAVHLSRELLQASR